MTSTIDTPAGPMAGRLPDTAWLLERTEALCRADTTTGREDHGLPTLRALLRELGAGFALQPVAPGRHNVLASWGAPRLLFATHLDTVPPFVPPRRQGDRLLGRGTCDAKGQVLAQLGAIQLLRRRGIGCAWLGVVGEETDSAGAIAAVDLAPQLQQCQAVLVGGPTGNVPASRQRGAVQLRLQVQGEPAHSGAAERGRSALWPLLGWLEALRQLTLRRDPEFGAETWNLASVQGGGAPNVVPGRAEAIVLLRSLPGSTFAAEAAALAPAGGHCEVTTATPPEVFDTVPGLAHAPVEFCSDAPYLRQLVPSRRVALCGPGSIATAHTADECITGAELLAGCERLAELGERLLAAAGRA